MSTNLALRNSAAVAPADWTVMRQQADVLVKTGFLPSAINTPEKAVAIILKGRELGVPAMHALSNIVVIQGKPACNAELMLALIYRDHGDDAIAFEEASAACATISYRRRGWRERRTFSFTAEDARTAGLAGGNWAKYPGAMLRARCISAVARLAFPDTIGGMYTAEELGATVNLETGEITTNGAHHAPAEVVVTTEPAATDEPGEAREPAFTPRDAAQRRRAQIAAARDALKAAEAAVATPVEATPPTPPEERIKVGDRIFTRPEAWAWYQQQAAEATKQGIPVSAVEADAPLRDLAGAARLLERQLQAL